MCQNALAHIKEREGMAGKLFCPSSIFLGPVKKMVNFFGKIVNELIFKYLRDTSFIPKS